MLEEYFKQLYAYARIVVLLSLVNRIETVGTALHVYKETVLEDCGPTHFVSKYLKQIDQTYLRSGVHSCVKSCRK
jgi:hypothetical protein